MYKDLGGWRSGCQCPLGHSDTHKAAFLKEEEEEEGRRGKSDLQRLAVGDLWWGRGGGTAVES